MKYWIILVSLALMPSLLGAQATSQQPLPDSPSTAKFPPPPAAPPPQAAPAQQTAPPASETTAPANQGPPADTPAAAAADPAKSAVPAPVAAPAAGGASATDSGGDDVPLTTIRKQVDEVNVVFTVTDKRGKFVKDLTQND